MSLHSFAVWKNARLGLKVSPRIKFLKASRYSEYVKELLSCRHAPRGSSDRQFNNFLALGMCPQETQGGKRKFDEVKSDLVAKVVDEACRLKRLRHAFEERRPDPSAANANACFSAIQASLQQGKLDR